MSSSTSPESDDLVTELLLGMRLSGVQYRRMNIAHDEGLGFENAPGRAQFHFVGRGAVCLRSPAGAIHTLAAGDALLIPRGGHHAILSTADVPASKVATFTEAVQRESLGDRRQVAEANAVIFSCCMEFDLGGMQPLVEIMPEVMLVDTLMESAPEIEPMLRAMEREALASRAGFAGVLARLADVVAALIVRGWAAGGCGGATGWVGALHDPRLGRAFLAMHQFPDKDWTVAALAKEVSQSRSVFAHRFLEATGISPLRYLTELRMRLAVNSIVREKRPVEAVAYELGYGSLAAFSRAFKRIVGHSPGTLRAMRAMPQDVV